MIGAIVYQLRAEQAAWLPIVHGRFMHAAFFAALPDQIKQRRMAPAQDPESKPVAAEILVQAEPEQMGLLQWSALPLPRTKQLFEIAL